MSVNTMGDLHKKQVGMLLSLVCGLNLDSRCTERNFQKVPHQETTLVYRSSQTLTPDTLILC